MEVVLVLGVIGFILRLSYTLAGLLFLWWRKEYRLDRMAIHLKTKQGENVLFGKTHMVLLLALACWFITPLSSGIVVFLSLGVFVLGVMYLRRLARWHLPPISPKVIALGVSSMVYIGLLFLLLPLPAVMTLTVADLLLFPFSLLVVLGVTIPTRLYHASRIRQAVNILHSHHPMTVIGITGSYGKTSVKEYLATVLSEHVSTIRTEASKNSPIGIAEALLRSLRPEHRAFVVEMGAYKRGEIAEMTRMVHPEIGILTAINPQHQDLFGSIETTMQAKYELLRGLTGRKIAIVNLDDVRTRRMGDWAARDGNTVWGWTTKNGGAKTTHCERVFRAAHVAANMNGITFDCLMGRERVPVSASVLGQHQVGNILAAIAGAVASSMKFADACRAASNVTAAEKVMHVVKGVNGAVYIDDTFNNNPDAAKAAITFLGAQHGKKIVVFQPMIELGAFAESSHEEVGKLAAACVDTILLTNSNFFASFERGVRSVSKDIPLLVFNPVKTVEYIRLHAHKGDIVLFKGKDTEHALKLLTA